MKEKINHRFWIIASVILAGGIFRLVTASYTLTPFTNFSPVGAMALFSGYYYRDRWKAYLLPLLTLWLSDILLNRFWYSREWILFYDGFPWVYASFALMVWFGNQLMKSISIKSVVSLAILGAISHWLITDFGMWLYGINIYTGLPFTRSWYGLMTCYELAIPFLKNMLIGNLVFGLTFFGLVEGIQSLFPTLKMEIQH